MEILEDATQNEDITLYQMQADYKGMSKNK